MPTELPGLKLTRVAAADLSTKQFYAVKIDAAGKAALAGLGEPAIGILQNKPATGQAAEIMITGVSKFIAAGVIAPGAYVAADANAKAVTATKASVNTSDGGVAADAVIGGHVLGIALNIANSAANDLIEVLLTHSGAVATTAA
jgi:hypothetical protein